MRLWPVQIFALLLMTSWPLFGQNLPSAEAPLGEKFIDLCKSPNLDARDACGGVVTSLMNAQVEMSRRDPKNRIICPPRTLTIEEGRRVFMQWVATTPDAPGMNFPDLVMQALRDRYQCADFLKQPGRK